MKKYMKENFDEFLIDAKLHIDTTGRDERYSDTYRYPYEPTAYGVLERIAESGYITKDDYLIDYGSGKGRVPIYFNDLVGCRATGIEMMEQFFLLAEKNQQSYRKKNEVSFVKTTAEVYDVPKDATCFFFFNPFSIEIMRCVMNRLLDSYYEHPRRMKLFFYYPQDEYVAFLMGVNELDFVDEIDCGDLFSEKDDRNRVLIFELPEAGLYTDR